MLKRSTNGSCLPAPLLKAKPLLTHAVFARVKVLQAKRLAKAGHSDVHARRCFSSSSSAIVDQPDAQSEKYREDSPTTCTNS